MPRITETTNLSFDSMRDTPTVWVSIEGAAEHFGVTPRTIDRWEKEEGLPVHRLGRGPKAHKRYDPLELDVWARSRCSAVPAGGA